MIDSLTGEAAARKVNETVPSSPPMDQPPATTNESGASSTAKLSGSENGKAATTTTKDAGLIRDNTVTPEERTAVLELYNLAKTEGIKIVSAFELLQYVIVCKRDVQKSLERLRKMRGIEVKYNFNKIDVDATLKELYDKKIFAPATSTACSKGVIAMQYSSFYPSEWESQEGIEKVGAGFLYLADLNQRTLEEVRGGLVMTALCSGMGWKNFSLEMEKRLTEFYQDGHPMKITGVVMVDPPLIIKVMLKLMAPFMKKKLRERIASVKLQNIPGKHQDGNVVPATTKNYVHGLHTGLLPTFLGGSFEDTFDHWLSVHKTMREQSIRIVAEQLPEIVPS